MNYNTSIGQMLSAPDCSPNCTAKEPEFLYITNSLEKEVSRFFNLTNELYRKVDGISRFKENSTDSPEPKPLEPNDFVSKMFYEIHNIRKENDKLEYLLSHLNQLV